MSIFFRTSNDKLFSVNEEVQREALKGFYDRCLEKRKILNQLKWNTKVPARLRRYDYFARNAEEQGEKTEQRLRQATLVAHFVSPIVAITFAVVYWIIGMYTVMYPGMQQQIWMTKMKKNTLTPNYL